VIAQVPRVILWLEGTMPTVADSENVRGCNTIELSVAYLHHILSLR
jgi:hypothetical protein